MIFLAFLLLFVALYGYFISIKTSRLEKEIRKNYTEISQKRVCTGLLIAEIGNQNDIQLDDSDINKALQMEMQRYPVRSYSKSPVLSFLMVTSLPAIVTTISVWP